MDDANKRPDFTRAVDKETGEVAFFFKVQNDPPVRVSAKGFEVLQKGGFTLNAHLNNCTKPSAQPRMRKPGDNHPYVMPTVIYEALKGEISEGDGVRTIDGNWRNCHEDNLILKSKWENLIYQEKVIALREKHFAERDQVKLEQATMKRFRRAG
jgi:hypothetical protein